MEITVLNPNALGGGGGLLLLQGGDATVSGVGTYDTLTLDGGDATTTSWSVEAYGGDSNTF